MRYWLTFNEINAVRGFGPCGTRQSEGQDRYQAAHHMFVASARAVKLGHEMMPNSQFGAMYAMSELYPATCKPEDVFHRLQERRENWYFIDIMGRGYYPRYVKEIWRRRGVKEIVLLKVMKKSLEKVNLILFLFLIIALIPLKLEMTGLMLVALRIHILKRRVGMAC